MTTVARASTYPSTLECLLACMESVLRRLSVHSVAVNCCSRELWSRQEIEVGIAISHVALILIYGRQQGGEMLAAARPGAICLAKFEVDLWFFSKPPKIRLP